MKTFRHKENAHSIKESNFPIWSKRSIFRECTHSKRRTPRSCTKQKLAYTFKVLYFVFWSGIKSPIQIIYLPLQTSYAARNCLNSRDAPESLPDSEVWVVKQCNDHEHLSRSNQRSVTLGNNAGTSENTDAHIHTKFCVEP